jgi:hypothetical protein
MSLKFNKSTDTEHKEKLDSTISYAEWDAGFARGGNEIGFHVITSFVGEGAKIKITGKSVKGKKLGKIKDVIHGNSYYGKLTVPEDIKLGDSVYFEVELSQLGLKDESYRIPAGPPIKVTNMRWDKKEARRGDILKLTADIDEVRDGTEAKVFIYEHDQDGNHDKIVELPMKINDNKLDLAWEYEYHEDTDEIPTQEELEKYGKNYNPPEYFFVLEIDGQRFGEQQESGLLEFKDWIEIELKDRAGKPAENEEYIIILPDQSEQKGKLDAEGKAKIENVPPGRIEIEYPNLEEGAELAQ